MKALGTCLAILGAFSVAGAQDHKEPPKPQKEHELLRQFEGQWEASSRNFASPAKSEECKGVETARIDYGGYWLLFTYKGEVQGKPFMGQGSMGYDPRKGKYVMTWIDSMAPYAMWGEGDADAAGKTFTFVSDGCDPDTGKASKVRTLFEIKDSNHRTLSFFAPGKDGPERKFAQIEYTRMK